MSGVNVGEHGMVGSMGVATKEVEPYHIVAGIPAKPIKVKTIAPNELRKALRNEVEHCQGRTRPRPADTAVTIEPASHGLCSTLTSAVFS